MAEENKPDEEVKVVEDADGGAIVGEPTVEEDDGDSDERLAKTEEVDEEEHSDTDSAEERAAKTERNRLKRRATKEFKKNQLETLKRELAARDSVINDLNQRMSHVERKSTGSDMAQLNNAEQQAIDAYNQLKTINARAIEQADGATAIDAQEKMYQVRQRYEQIQQVKKAYQQKQNAPQPLDPRLVNHAQEWMGENKWYDPTGKDEDSSVVLALDNRLAAEGWNPTTPEYWEELGARVKKYLPHRAGMGYSKSQVGGNRKAPPIAGSGREGGGVSQGTYKLSADRVQALKDAGIWDDPKQRAESIKRYQQFDKESRA